MNSKAYSQIIKSIENPEVTFVESPLLQDLNIQFDRTKINLNAFFEKYKLTDSGLAFDHINFSEVSENELNFLKNLYHTNADLQKQLIILFILLIVLKQNSFFNIFDSEGLHYNMIFNPLFLPFNPLEKCSKDLIIYINDFLSLEYINHPTEVIQAINTYVEKTNNKFSLYNFLPFFIKLLQNSDSEFIQIFICSDLFKKIIEISQKELPFFDFYRHLIFQFPEIAFQQATITQSMLKEEFFFDETRNQSVIILFERAIETFTGPNVDQYILKEILIVFSFIISTAHEKGKEKSMLVTNMISCIDNFFNIIPYEVDLSLFFEAAATFAVYSENEKSFELFIDLIRKLIIQRPSFIFQLQKQKIFFNTLSKYKKKFNYKYLINLAKLTPDGMIHLYKVISVLLDLIQNIPEDEENIANELVIMSQNSGNIIELDRAKVPDFILKRLPIIQEKEEICEKYLNLFEAITAKTFSKITFLHTIELLKNPKFKYSSSILDILNRYLENFFRNYNIDNNNYSAFQYRKDQLYSHNEPFSFFRFDNQTGCGIICPNMTINSPLTFCFWLRINEINPNKNSPLIFFENKKYKLNFFLKNNHVFLDNSIETYELTGYPEIEQGKWYFLCFTIDKTIFNHSLTFNISDENNENSCANIIKFQFNPGEYKLHICRMPISSQTELDHPSLICDISAFLLLNESLDYLSIKQKVIEYLSSKELNMNYFSYLLCLFNPSQSQNNICFNVNKNLPQVPYTGRIIPIIPNFCDVIQNIEAIQTFLPLIDALSNEDDGENNKKKLHLIISIFCNAINICEASFLKSRFFELLVSFLYNCESLIDKESFKDLLEMFLIIKNPELKKSLVTSIYLNYNFLSNLSGSVESLFYSYSPLHLYQTKEDGFKLVFDDLSLIIYTGVKYFDHLNDNSKYYWNYIKRLVLDSPSDKNINFLIDFLSEDKNIKSEFVALHILDVLHSVFEQKTEINEMYNDFIPYIITYSQYHESLEILKLVLMIIKIVSKKTNMGDAIYPSIYHLMIVIRPSLNCNQNAIEELINIVLQMIIEDEMISYTSFLPILLNYSKSKYFGIQVCNSFVNSDYIHNNISSIPFWTYWLTKLFLQAYNTKENTKEFAYLCILCLKNISLLVDLMDFFDIYNGIASNLNDEIDFEVAKETILTHLINSKKIDYSYVYHFMLFSIKTVKKESNFPLSYFGDFVQELFSNFDINVSLKSTVNEQLLNLLISKTETILTKITSGKVQLFGNRVEVPFKDINAYLSNLIENNQNEEEEIQELATISRTKLMEWMNLYKEMIEEKLKNNIKWCQDLNNTLKFERQYTESDEKPIEYKLLFVLDLNKYNYYYENNEKHKFYSDLVTKYKNENNYLNKMKNSFMDSISLFPGPWEDSNKNASIKRFKLLNRVSKNGKRILMKINKKFNDHSDASLNRVQAQYINNTDKLIYKTLETAPESSDSNTFKAKIMIYTPAKDDKGFLNATNNYISLMTESSNKYIYWEDIEFILNRKEGCLENSIEIFINNGKSYFITFIECERKHFYSYIDKLKLNYEIAKFENKFDFFNSLRICCKGIYQKKKIQTIIQDIDLVNIWKKRKITTFSYIYYLNLLSGRSYNYICQYIIYPFIINDSDSSFLLLNDEKSYRKLDQPMPTISNEMLQIAINKYSDYYDMEPFLFSEIPSSSLAVSWYLIRTEPFTTIHVSKDQQCYNFPRFDNPDRIFSSVKYLLKLVNVSGYAKEMVPEFFTLPYFLINENNFVLGIRSDNKRVQNIELPSWSKCCYSFVSALRLMLENPISDNLIGKWIDIIFGIKRRIYKYHGKDYNLYKSYLYPETSNILFNDEIINCGSLPDQLFNEECPSREKANNDPSSFDTNINFDKIDKRHKSHFVKNLLVCPGDSKAYELQSPYTLSPINLKNICGNVLCYSKSLKIAIYGTKADPFLTFFDLNSMETKIECQSPFIITSVYLTAGRYLITGGKDCSIRVWDLNGQNKKVNYISSSGYHTDVITSIGCCFDNGLLVSIDKKQTIVFETMIDHVFINSVSLIDMKKKLEEIDTTVFNKDDDDEEDGDMNTDPEFVNLFSFSSNLMNFMNDVAEFQEKRKNQDNDDETNHSSLPQILVFKSGVVAVSCGSDLFLFDVRGKLMSVKPLDSEIVEIHKIYGTDLREFLIVGAKPDKIYIFDVVTLSFVYIYRDYFSSITSLQKGCSFITYYKGKIQTINFSPYLPTFISKIEPKPVNKKT